MNSETGHTPTPEIDALMAEIREADKLCREALELSHYNVEWGARMRDERDALLASNAKLVEALESLRKNIDAGLLTALRNGGQLDIDGCEVRVSRQACEEAADHLEQLAATLRAMVGK